MCNSDWLDFNQSSICGVSHMNFNNLNGTLPKSLFDTEYTYVYGGYLCVKAMYPIHIIFAYFVCLSGIGAMATRVINPIKALHVWFGRLFMVSMFCCMATSLLIYNTGLPTYIIVFFTVMTVGYCGGWLAIKIHAYILDKQAFAMLQERLKSKQVEIGPTFNLEAELGKVKGEILTARTFIWRWISWKSLHGIGMFMAWWMVFGRIIVTNPMIWVEDGCWAYPVYKPGAIPGKSGYVPVERESNLDVPLFSSLVTIIPLVAVILFGLCWSFICSQIDSYKLKNKQGSKIVQDTHKELDQESEDHSVEKKVEDQVQPTVAVEKEVVPEALQPSI